MSGSRYRPGRTSRTEPSVRRASSSAASASTRCSRAVRSRSIALASQSIAAAAVGLQRGPAGGQKIDQDAAPVGGIGPALDQPGVEQRRDGRRHRLRAHPLVGGQVADPRRPGPVEPAQHGHLAKAERGVVALGAQPAHQPAEHDPEVSGEFTVSVMIYSLT